MLTSAHISNQSLYKTITHCWLEFCYSLPYRVVFYHGIIFFNLNKSLYIKLIQINMILWEGRLKKNLSQVQTGNSFWWNLFKGVIFERNQIFLDLHLSLYKYGTVCETVCNFYSEFSLVKIDKTKHYWPYSPLLKCIHFCNCFD